MVIKIIKKEKDEIPKAPKKIRKVAPSFRVKKVIDMVEKGGVLGSKAEILRKAKFSEAVQRNPDRVFNQPAVREAVDNTLARMKEQRDKALQRMDETVSKASYGSVALTVSMLTKDIELLEGRPTSREEAELSAESKARIDKLLSKNRKKNA